MNPLSKTVPQAPPLPMSAQLARIHAQTAYSPVTSDDDATPEGTTPPMARMRQTSAKTKAAKAKTPLSTGVDMKAKGATLQALFKPRTAPPQASVVAAGGGEATATGAPARDTVRPIDREALLASIRSAKPKEDDAPAAEALARATTEESRRSAEAPAAVKVMDKGALLASIRASKKDGEEAGEARQREAMAAPAVRTAALVDDVAETLIPQAVKRLDLPAEAVSVAAPQESQRAPLPDAAERPIQLTSKKLGLTVRAVTLGASDPKVSSRLTFGPGEVLNPIFEEGVESTQEETLKAFATRKSVASIDKRLLAEIKKSKLIEFTNAPEALGALAYLGKIQGSLDSEEDLLRYVIYLTSAYNYLISKSMKEETVFPFNLAEFRLSLNWAVNKLQTRHDVKLFIKTDSDTEKLLRQPPSTTQYLTSAKRLLGDRTRVTPLELATAKKQTVQLFKLMWQQKFPS
jgi:hypothetical protein